MLVAAGLFLACAYWSIAMAIPLVKRMVPPNRAFGFPTKATFADEWVWYEANAASGRDLLYLAAAQLAVVFVPLGFLRPASWTGLNIDRPVVVYLAINLGVYLPGLLVLCVIGYVRANRLLRERIATAATLKPKR
jgi:hypothetical protein